MCVLAIILAIHMANKYENFKLRYVYNNLGPYGFLVIEGAIFAAYVIILVAFSYYFFHKPQLKMVLTFAVAVEAVIMGTATLYGHGFEDYMNVNGGYSNNVVFQNLIDQIRKDDPTYYRCYSSQENSSARNDSMRHNYNGLGMFHSVYNYNTAAFLNWSQLTDYTAPGSYSASYVEKRQDLDTFLGVKYYFVHKDKAFWGNKEAQDLKSEQYRANVPLGFKDITSKYPNSSYYVYENENFVDFAFSYDQVATYSNLEEDGTVKEPSRLFSYTYQSEELYLKAAIVGENNVKYVKDLLPEENIRDYSEFRSSLDVKTISPTEYTLTYYDIHGDAEKNRTDASSYNFASKLLDLSEYPSSAAKPEKWQYNGRYVTVIEPVKKFPYDPTGIVFYLKNSYIPECDINLYLVTEDEEGQQRFVTFDNHNDSNLSNNWTSRKNWRGVYSAPTYDENGDFVAAPKITKIIIASRKTNMEKYELAYKTGSHVKDTVETLKENSVLDVHYKTNHFDFKTDYDHRRVVVTQLPYEDGFKLKATLPDGTVKNLDIFTAQGGFVSFVSEVGDVSYSLDFYTPYLSMSSYISSIGLFMFVTSALGYMYISLNWLMHDNVKDKEYRRNSVKNPIF